MNAEAVKYSRIEYEKRFLVAADAVWKNYVEPYSKTFEDKYIRGSRLRLRLLTDSDTNRQLIKLTKKYESDSPYYQQISTIILSAGEYQVFDALEGYCLKKIRYYRNHGGRVFSIDVFEDDLDGLILCETEADGIKDLMSVKPPIYAKHEVTEDAFFTGGNLCRTMHADLLHKLSAYG